MSHESFMKKVLWNGMQLCAVFVGTRLFSWLSGSFKGGWVVHHEEGSKLWGMDALSPDALNPWIYRFLTLTPRGHGMLMITC